MNYSLLTPKRFPSALNVSPILNQNGFTCTFITLQGGAEAVLPESHSPDEQLLFVVEGGISVRVDGLTTLVNPGGAFVLPPGGAVPVSTSGGAPARLLRVEIPARRVITPQIITLGV